MISLILTQFCFAQISFNIAVTNVSGNYYDGQLVYNGSFTIKASGGTGPYEYKITNNPGGRFGNSYSSNGYFGGLPPFTYNVSVFDVSGQKIADTIVTVTTVYPQPSLFCFLKMPSACDSVNGRIIFLGQGGTPPYSYSIDGGVSFSSSDTFPNLPQGFYNCLLKDANGFLALFTTSYCYRNSCPPPLTYPPYFGPDPACSFFAKAYSSAGSNCNNNGRIEISAYPLPPPLVSYPPFSYSMDGINYFPTNTTEFSTAVEDSLPPGLYNIHFKDSIGQTQIFSVQIPKFCEVQIKYIGVDASCQQSDGRITITASDGTAPYTYTMDGINFQSSNTFSNLAAGTYNFSVKDANDIITTSGATIFNKCPVVSATGTDEICGNKKGIIAATGIKGTKPYQFSIDGIYFQTDSFFNNLGTGVYKVILKDANDFMDSISVTIKNNCLLVTALSINETCGNKNGSTTVTASEGTPPYLYSIDGINFQSNNIFTGLANGIYSITAKDSGGLFFTIKDTIANIAAPISKAVATTAGCDGTGAVITVSNTGGTAPFQYSLDSLNFQSSNVFNNVSAGNYVVVVKDSNQCIVKDSIQVSKYPVPAVFIGNDTGACAGQTILLKAPAGLQYQWQDGSTGNLYAAKTTGLYWVKVTNQYNCFAIDTINIVFKPLPSFSLGNDTSLCTNQVLNIKISSAPITASYLWNTGNTTSALLINDPGLYWLKVSDSGCVSTDSILVNYKPLPTVNLGKDTILCEGNILQLNTGNSDSYLWQDGTAASSYSVSQQGTYSVQVTKNNCVNRDTINVDYLYKPHFTLGADQFICKGQPLVLDPSLTDANLLWQDGSRNKTFTVTMPGLYSLSATNKCGSVSDSVLITQGVCNLYMPTAFTPNGDAKNDVFKAGFGEDITTYHLQVYNRFGQLVFETKDKNAGWDGRLNRKEQPAGAYIWLVQYSIASNKTTQQLKGTVLLIR
jgi:gliding motility-associated-like protein